MNIYIIIYNTYIINILYVYYICVYICIEKERGERERGRERERNTHMPRKGTGTSEVFNKSTLSFLIFDHNTYNTYLEAEPVHLSGELQAEQFTYC